MRRKSESYGTPVVIRRIAAPIAFGFILSGCSSYTIVPTDELKAEREAQQALELKRRELVGEVGRLNALRAGLETQLVAESRKREVVETHQLELEEKLKAQRSTEQALNELEQKWEQWRARDKKLHLAQEQARTDNDAKLYLLLLEKRAQIASLSEQLEAAILEVVRTKAKLRSVDSKAEAASNLAEAEIAVETLKARGERWQRDPGVVKAAELNGLSAIEFRKGNYSGALYLTGEAKNVIKSAQARSLNQEMTSIMEGEVAFALPLPLRLLEDSDIREGPGDQSSVLFTASKGTPLIAYSYLGQWVRVANNRGDQGWVFYRRLANPN